MSFAAAFADIATAFGDEGPFHPAIARWQGEAVTDAGGSIVTPAQVDSHECMVQHDTVTQAMREQEGFVETDVRLVVIQLDRQLDTDAEIEVLSGPKAGRWIVEAMGTDPVAIGYEARGRKAKSNG